MARKKIPDLRWWVVRDGWGDLLAVSTVKNKMPAFKVEEGPYLTKQKAIGRVKSLKHEERVS